MVPPQRIRYFFPLLLADNPGRIGFDLSYQRRQAELRRVAQKKVQVVVFSVGFFKVRA